MKRIQRADDLNEIAHELEIAELLIKKGDYQMCCFLGIMYYMEDKAWHDYEKAESYFELAAENGEPVAQLYLGMMHYMGTSKHGKDDVLGGYYIRMSASNGNKYAMHFLRMQGV